MHFYNKQLQDVKFKEFYYLKSSVEWKYVLPITFAIKKTNFVIFHCYSAHSPTKTSYYHQITLLQVYAPMIAHMFCWITDVKVSRCTAKFYFRILK